MSQRQVYIDYNATTPIRDEVKASMIADLGIYGNASSLHESGRRAHSRLEAARASVAQLVGAPAESIVFTSGGSESNNTVFQTMRRLASQPDGRLKAEGRTEIITTAIEHPCVLKSAEYLASLGFKVTFLPVDGDGLVNPDDLKNALNDRTLFVSVMMANNEIGTIQDITELARLTKAAGAYFHTDAVQAAGKVPVRIDGIDYLTLSAHKIYGPKGVGALYVRKGAPLFPLIHGGHQENGYRAGTYNNAGIFAFGEAAELAFKDLDEYGKTMLALRTRLRDGLLEKIPGIKINGHPEKVLPNTLNVSFPGAEGEAILLSMDLMGIAASTGSACASGSLDPSHVLLALGLGPELSHGSIRFSLGRDITTEDIDYIIETMPPLITRLRAMSTVQG